MFVPIISAPNYSISNSGIVKNNTTGHIKKPYINKNNGYLTVDLWMNGKPCKRTLHRLLAEAFIPNPENKPTIDHIDGNRQNNSLDNLRWASYSENNSRFDTHGVRSEKIKVYHYTETRKKRGGGHVSWDDNDFVLNFDSITDTAAYFNTTLGNISLMLSKGIIGVRGKMRGYKFEYVKKKIN